MVSADKQIWHCFGCGKGGDVFGFVKDIEGLEFADALRLLAKRAGVTLERQDTQADSQRTRILEVLRQAARWYHQALLSAKSGDVARAYVAERRMSDPTRDEWEIGFAPDAWEGLLTYLRSRGFRDQEITAAGLAIANDRGGFYDRFRNRLMFPIRDVHGSTIGFTGRKLASDDIGGKYINTPETLVYHKSDVLYGLSRAKQEIRNEKLAVVVEGNMDCISSHQAGIKNVVAASGTALTPEQVRLLKRYASTIALAFDPDAAGQHAALRGLEVAWREDIVIKVIPLPEGEDPDALVLRDQNEWKERIAQAEDVMDWLFSSASAQHDVSTAQGKKEATKMLVPWIQRIPDLVVQTHYIQKLALLVHVDDSLITGLISKKQASRSGPSATPAEPAPKAKPARSGLDKTALRLFALILADNDPHAIADFNVVLIPDEAVRTLYKSIDFFYDDDVSKQVDAWIASLADHVAPLGREAVLIADELSSSLTREDRERERKTLISRLEQASEKEKRVTLRLKIREAEAAGDTDTAERLSAEVNNLSRTTSS